MKNQSFSSAIAVILIHIMKELKLMPFLSMNLSTLASQSSQLVNELQYSLQILKHLCDFPLPQCRFGYYSSLSAPKYVWLNIGEGEGHIRVRTKVRRVNVQNFPKNSRKTGFVSMICEKYCCQ